MTLTFDSIDTTFQRVVASTQWSSLSEDFASAKLVLIIGNGGNLAVADHAAIDISRLTNKVAIAPGSGIVASSIINDSNHDMWLEYWTSIYVKRLRIDPSEILVIGLSSSGISKNVFNALSMAASCNCKAHAISAMSTKEIPTVNTIVLDVKQYHTSEVTFLLLTYELIHSSGFSCPEIPLAARSSTRFDYSDISKR